LEHPIQYLEDGAIKEGWLKGISREILDQPTLVNEFLYFFYSTLLINILELLYNMEDNKSVVYMISNHISIFAILYRSGAPDLNFTSLLVRAQSLMSKNKR
jgi:hypothetical protein